MKRYFVIFLIAFQAFGQSLFPVSTPSKTPAAGKIPIGTGTLWGAGDLVAGSGISLSYSGGNITVAATGGGGGITDGDKGEIIVSGSGTTWTIDQSALATKGVIKVPNMAALRVLSGMPLGTVAEVAGYYGEGDGGGFTAVHTNTITGTNALGGRVLANGGATSWEAMFDAEGAPIECFGGVAGDSASDDAAFEAMSVYFQDKLGGTIRLGRGVYNTLSGVRLRYRVSLKGADPVKFSDATSTNPANNQYLLGSASFLRVMDGANVPAITFYSTNGWVRQAAETLEDGSVVDSVQQDSTVENLLVFGNSSNQSSYGSHGLFAENKWGIKIKNVYVWDVLGWGGFLLDCNGVEIDETIFKSNPWRGGRGVFLYSCGDSKIDKIDVGAASGPALWVDGLTSWKLKTDTSFLWNSFRTNSAYAATAVSSDAFTLIGSVVALESGSPVMVRPWTWESVSGTFTNALYGTLPTGITSTNLYWAVKVGANSFGVHTNRAAALAGTKLPLSGFAGTNGITVGPAVGIQITGRASQNTFANIGIDQCSDGGVYIQGANNNVILPLVSANHGGSVNGESSWSVPSVWFGQNSVSNVVGGQLAYSYWGAYAEPSAFNNQWIGSTFEASVPLYESVAGQNVRPYWARWDGVVSAFAAQTMTVGDFALSTVTDFKGGTSGSPIWTAERSGAIKSGWRVSGPSVQIFDETNVRLLGQFYNDGANIFFQQGANGVSTQLPITVQAGSASGTDKAAAAYQIITPRGTGSGSVANGYFRVQVPIAGSSGTTAHAARTALQVDGQSNADQSSLLLDLDGSLTRVLVGASGTGPAGNGKALYVPGVANQGFPLPGMTGTQRDAIGSPANGLTLYNSTANKLNVRENGAWVSYQLADSDLDTWAGITPSANVITLLGAADYAAMRTQLGLVIGSNIQAWDADLDDLADGTLSGSKVGSGINAANITAGTLPDARFPATLPAASGVNLTTLNASNLGSGTVASARLPSPGRPVTYGVNNYGTVITAGDSTFVELPVEVTGTITKAVLVADQAGSAVVDVQKASSGGFPTFTSIAASAKPTLSAAQRSIDTTLTGWTTSVTAGDTFRFRVDSASTVTRLTLVLTITPP